MTSRERVRAVLRHEIPDVLPNCWGGCETEGLHILPYARLVEALGLGKRPSRVDTFMFNAVMDEDVLRAMHGDMLLVASPRLCARPLRGARGWKKHELFGIPIELTDDYALEWGEDGMIYLLRDGVRSRRCPATGTYFDRMPDEDMFDMSEVPDPSEYHPANYLTDEKLRELEEAAREAYERTEFSLSLGESINDLQLMPGGMIAWYDAMINEPEIVDEYLAKNTELAFEQITLLEQAVGKYCDTMCVAHDFGDSNGVTMGAPLFRKCYKQHYKRLFEGWHKRTRMKINLHSCGSIAEIIPDLIECGVDVLNPVQISAAGMQPERIKALAGDKLVLFGGAFDSTQTPAATDAQTVYEQVKKNIEVLGKGGGFLFSSVHNVAADTPREHIEAVLRAYSDMRNMYHG